MGEDGQRGASFPLILHAQTATYQYLGGGLGRLTRSAIKSPRSHRLGRLQDVADVDPLLKVLGQLVPQGHVELARQQVLQAGRAGRQTGRQAGNQAGRHNGDSNSEAAISETCSGQLFWAIYTGSASHKSAGERQGRHNACMWSGGQRTSRRCRCLSRRRLMRL